MCGTNYRPQAFGVVAYCGLSQLRGLRHAKAAGGITTTEIVMRRNVLCATVKIMASGNLPTKSGKGDWNVVRRKATEVGFFLSPYAVANDAPCAACTSAAALCFIV